MKFIISILLLMPVALSYSQEMKLNISARNESITVSLDDDNNDKVLRITSSAQNLKQDYLTVKVSDGEMESELNRNFTFHDSDDNEIAALKPMMKNEYCINLKNILPKIKLNSVYSLYTVAIPKDPKKAMLVRPARKLVCKVILADN